MVDRRNDNDPCIRSVDSVPHAFTESDCSTMTTYGLIQS
jgi:hypothetical protein